MLDGGLLPGLIQYCSTCLQKRPGSSESPKLMSMKSSPKELSRTPEKSHKRISVSKGYMVRLVEKGTFQLIKAWAALQSFLGFSHRSSLVRNENDIAIFEL